MRRSRPLLMIMLLLAPLALVLAAPRPVGGEEESVPTGPALVRLWSASGATAELQVAFASNDSAVVVNVFDCAPDAGRFTTPPAAFPITAGMYDVRTGEFVGSLEQGCVYDARTLRPILNDTGYLSGDGRLLLSLHSYNVTVIETGKQILVNWTIQPGNIRDLMFTYNGSRFAAVFATGSDTILGVYEYDPDLGMYVEIYRYTWYTGGYAGGCVSISDDGNVIVVVRGPNNYAELFCWNGTTYVHWGRLPLPAGGLVLTRYPLILHYDNDTSYYIAIGDFGNPEAHANVFLFDPRNGTLTRVFRRTVVSCELPAGAWYVYTPRRVPRRAGLIVFVSAFEIGGAYWPAGWHPPTFRNVLVYDVRTNTSTIITVPCPNIGPDKRTPMYQDLGGVSASGRYVFGDGALIMVLRRDPQSGNPRARFWGEIRLPRRMIELGRPLALTAPLDRDWHAYFFGGTLVIDALVPSAVPTQLIKDKDLLEGKIAKLAHAAYVIPTYFDGAEMEGWRIESGHSELWARIKAEMRAQGWCPPEDDRVILVFSTVKFRRLFREARAVYALAVPIRLGTPVSPYDSIVFEGDLYGFVGIIGYDWVKHAVAIVTGLPVVVGAAGGGGAAVGLSALSRVFRAGVVAGTVYWRNRCLGIRPVLYAAAKMVPRAARAAGWVGVAIFVEAGAEAALYSKYVGLLGPLRPRFIVTVVPVLLDDAGNRYTVLSLFAPDEAIRSGEVYTYADGIRSFFALNHFRGVGLDIVECGRTWDDYFETIRRTGINVRVNLVELIRKTLVPAYNVDVDKLRIASLLLLVVGDFRARTGVWDYLSGLELGTTIVLYASKLSVSALPRSGEVIRDPARIAALIGNVTVNGMEFPVEVVGGAARCAFSIPEGASELVIDFGRPGWYGVVRGSLEVCVKKDFEPVGGYGYTVTLHYDWPGTELRLERVELVDMPYPALFIERVIRYRYGAERHIVFINTSAPEAGAVISALRGSWMYKVWERNGNMFELLGRAGGRYCYVTFKNTVWIDPANSGTLQPCERVTFNYFYALPPDAWVSILFNGTSEVGTQPQHISIRVGSSAGQYVTVNITITVQVLDYETHEWRTARAWSLEKTVYVSDYEYIILDAAPYLDEALRWAEAGLPVTVMVRAEITAASEGDFIKTNDVDEKPLPILPTLRRGEPCDLYVLVYDALNGTPIPGVQVRLAFENGTLVGTEATDASGYAHFVITQGVAYRVVAAPPEGYIDPTEGAGYPVLVVGKNMTVIRYPLLFRDVEKWGGEEYEFIAPGDPRFRGNWTHPPYPILLPNGTILWTVAVQVTYNDTAPFEGAEVTVYDHSTGAPIARGRTNGTGFAYFWIRDGRVIDIRVRAVHDGTEYVFWRNNTLVDRTLWLVFTVPASSELYTPEVGILVVAVRVHRGVASYFGENQTHAVFAVLWTNKPQQVTVRYDVVDAAANETIVSFNRTYTLALGVNPVYEFFEVNLNRTVKIRVRARIVAFEHDTDPGNNEAWSPAVTLRPFANFYVFCVWVRPVRQRTAFHILPEDVIEIDIGVYIPVNTTSIPAVLRWGVLARNLTTLMPTAVKHVEEEIRARAAGLVWRNFTLTVPWTDEITITVNVAHPWEDMALDNNETLKLDIAPDVKLVKVEVPRLGIVKARTKVTVKIIIKSNVPAEAGATMVISAYSATTNETAAVKPAKIMPYEEITLEIAAPENPPLLKFKFWKFEASVIREPLTTHNIVVEVAGYDAWPGDNAASFKMTVLSAGFVALLLIVGVLLAAATVYKMLSAAARHTIISRRKFWRKDADNTIRAVRHAAAGRRRFWRRR